MKTRKCPICSAKMLAYENPPRLLCPRVAKHYLWLGGKKLGKKVYNKSIPGWKTKKKK